MADADPPPPRKRTKRVAGTKVGPSPEAGDALPHIPGFNLAGRPDSLKKKEGGLKRNEFKAVGPYHTGNVNTETYWHFIIRSSKNEWIRFKPDSLSMLLYGVYENPARDDRVGQPASVRAADHALQAGNNAPGMFLDPTVLGTSFVDRVDVSINNVPVPTNSAVGKLLLQYVRVARIFNSRPDLALVKNTDAAYAAARANLKAAMRRATAPFDYYAWNSQVGQRVPVFLDGIFPFDFKNKTLESVDREREPNLYFPPDTEIAVKVHVHPNKIEGVFHNEVTLQRYFDPAVICDRPGGNLRLSVQEVTLEYESAELMASEHVKVMKQYLDGGLGVYDYDIARGQNQPLTPGASYTHNSFQLMPHARLAYIMFLPDHATFPMEATRKPLSGLSRFPENSADMTIDFAGEANIITPHFVNFGKQAENHHISMKIYHDYLVRNHMTSYSFDDFFPRDAAEYSLVQCFVVDLKNHLSDRTELLNLKSTYTGGTSPPSTQVVCISVHPNGRATCRSSGTQFEWIWSFSQLA